MRKPVLVAACLIGLAAAGGLGLYATYQREYLVTETEKAEFVGLQQSLDGLQKLCQAEWRWRLCGAGQVSIR